MTRRILAVFLALGLMVGSVSAAFVNPAAWALSELEAAAEAKLIPDGIAASDMWGQISRAEFAALSVRLYETLAGAEASTDGVAAFSDSSDPSVLKAVALGITNGTGGGRFTPGDPVSRQDAATMLSRVYKKLNYSGWDLENDRNFLLPLTRGAEGIVFYEDHDRIDDWARDAVYFLNAFGIVKGDNHRHFNPHNRDGAFADGTGTTTRQEAILMSLRAFQAFPGINR